jgi:hypothetical protein
MLVAHQFAQSPGKRQNRNSTLWDGYATQSSTWFVPGLRYDCRIRSLVCSACSAFPQSDRIAGITFCVAVLCLVLAFEKVFPSVYSRSTRRSPWLQSRAGLAVATVIFGIIISILSSGVATIWFALTVIGSVLVALLLRASDEEL